MTRVAITGIGVVSCLGRGKAAHLDAIESRRSGIGRLQNLEASDVKCRIGGAIPAAASGPAPSAHDRFTGIALLAAGDAAAQAAYDRTVARPERVGAIIGTAMGGCETMEASYKRLYGSGATRFPPTVIASSMYNAAVSAVSAAFQARGMSYAIVSACASSAHAIGAAAQAIRAGQADVMFAGGSDAPLVPGCIKAWEAMRVLAIDNEHPERACRPFSADRHGLVLSEAAAILVLESAEHARARGATILGEIAGYGATSDAGHVTDPSAEGAARAMRDALDDAGLPPQAVEYINAHGTATRANDVTETRAIKQVFGRSAQAIAVSSTKSQHGHAMGASGALEIACSLIALNAGVIPATINLEQRDPACDLDYVADGPRRGQPGVFLSNSFGFGGLNAAVVVRTANAMDL